jgi:hypothetical protein
MSEKADSAHELFRQLQAAADDIKAMSVPHTAESFEWYDTQHRKLIASLLADRDRYKAALEQIAGTHKGPPPWDYMTEIARRALNGSDRT